MSDPSSRGAGASGTHRPLPDPEHQHDRWCGHPSVRHGDHVDFLHDGQVHRPCADHTDEASGCDEPVHELHLPHGAHMHVHRSDCDHRQVAHLDHVDYLHGQHRHARHGTHYDEH